MTYQARLTGLAWLLGFSLIVVAGWLIRHWLGLALAGSILLSLGGLKHLLTILLEGLARCPPSIWHTGQVPNSVTDSAATKE